MADRAGSGVKPFAIDLFCGLGGWTDGLLAEGYHIVGFDIERHRYAMPEVDHEADGSKGTNPVEKRGWTQGCAVSLGMEGLGAKPRTRLVGYPAQLVLQDVLTLHGRQFKDAALIVASPPCQFFSYCAMPWSRAKALATEVRADPERTRQELALFNACFRIQREAIEAARHFIPLVVENVRGAQPWGGRSRWNYGSYHLWGDVPALMPMTRTATKWGSGQSPGNRFDQRPLGNIAAHREGQKISGLANKRDGYHHTRHLTNQAESDGVKQGGDWFNADQPSISRMCGSKSSARKAASAAIAKIPFPLARHIAAYWKPR